MTRRRTAWQLEADRRWPDAMDMVEPAIGDGQWATLAWCGPLTVHLHHTRDAAERALAIIEQIGCGHRCWGDHELVDLGDRDRSRSAVNRARLERRLAHFAICRTCGYVFDGQAPDAARRRHGTRRAAA